ncbi:modification methylase [uncultured Candidatus Thioglobus sp.]|nr:modification methylase [uncultured Candidatus Thioglobus sp.]
MLVDQNNYREKNFSDLSIFEEWNFEQNKECKMHKIHAYPAKFPAFITTQAIRRAEKDGLKIHLVADMFCGCGTTAYEAKLNEKDFWGCDINPIATLIANTKVGSYKPSMIEKYLEDIRNLFNTIELNHTTEIRQLNSRIFYWFELQQIKDLAKLKKAILQTIPAKSKYKKLFLCGFSNILKASSKWLQRSIKPTIDKNKKIIEVLPAFSQQIKKMQLAVTEQNKNPVNKTSIKIETTNFLTKKILKPKADLLITSPPYVTSYEYADLHQLSSLWINEVDDYKTLRKGTIGSCYSKEPDNHEQLNRTGQAIIDNLLQKDKGRARNVKKYFIDIQNTVKQASRLLRDGGLSYFVIGNTEYKEVLIDNAKHLIESMFNENFKNIRIEKRKISNKSLTPYRTKEGKFSSDKTCRKIYAEEFIIIGSK